ncbi:MAG TPA: hypothetical protein VJP40_06255 [bacterium]|nr:hypothetical protein [bacterium]
MFWQSLWHGLQVLGNGDVLIATLLFLAAEALFHGALRWTSAQKENEDALSAGCLAQIFGVLFQALALGCLLAWLSPVLLGLEARASWASIEPFLMVAIRAGVIAALAISLLAFLPFIGRFLAGSPGMEILIGGGLLFRLLSHPYLEGKLGRKIEAAAVYPGLWECLGYLLLAFLAGRLLMLATIPFRSQPGQRPNRFVLIWGPTLDALVGLVVLFMYARYVAIAVQ